MVDDSAEGRGYIDTPTAQAVSKFLLWVPPSFAIPAGKVYNSASLAMDAQYYAEDYGVELSEAIRRLTLQEPIGKLGATLESNEADTLGVFWIQHEPEYRVVAAFTKDGEKTIAKYVQDGPLVDIIEVRTVDATLKELKRAQQEAGSIVRGLGFQAASGINVFENRAEIYVPDPSRLEEALQENGKTLPAHAHIVGQGLPARKEVS